MKTLKNRYKIYLIVIVIVQFISTNCKGQNNYPLIDIEVVRNDIISHEVFFGPTEYLKELEPPMFKVYYIDKHCLIQIPFKNDDTECDEKYSLVVLYCLKNKKWIYENSIPYYYEISLIKGQYFLSNNLFCKMDGNCRSYSEITAFLNGDFIKIDGYYSFNKLVYYDGLLSLDRTNEAKNAIGDTIVNEIEMDNFIFGEKERLKSYDLSRKIVVLKEIKDGLITQTINSRITVNMENIRSK